MKKYYIEMQDECCQVVFQSAQFFDTKKAARLWVFENLCFQNGYHKDLYIITCENKEAKNDDDFFNLGYDDVDSTPVYR